MATLKQLIECEISDFFAGFGHPGEPETPEEMQSQLLARVMPLLAWLEHEPVAKAPELSKVIYHFRDWNEGFPVEKFKADYVISWMLANYPPAPPSAPPQLPQPAVPDAISTRQAISKMEECEPCDSINVAYKYGWNACRAAMLQGAGPVQGWIPCSERMPDNCDGVFAWSGGSFSYSVEAYFDGSWYRTLTDEEEHHITHWMPLPSAPQQEADNG